MLLSNSAVNSTADFSFPTLPFPISKSQLQVTANVRFIRLPYSAYGFSSTQIVAVASIFRLIDLLEFLTKSQLSIDYI